jgi:hypothetical protein
MFGGFGVICLAFFVGVLCSAGLAPGAGHPAPPTGGPSVRPPGPLFQDGTYLVVEVVPADADVYLDGRWLGKAETLSRNQIPILPGRRTVRVTRRGYRPYVGEFVARPVGIPTRLRVVLVPD